MTDVLVVNVAMPSIGAGLHASGAPLQLVVGGYTIAYATGLRGPRLVPPDPPRAAGPPRLPGPPPPGRRRARLDLAVVFVLLERRVAARGGEPLLNLDVLRAPALPSGLAAPALTPVAYGGVLFACTLYLQEGLGHSPLRAGLTYLPMAATFGLAGYFWRRLPSAVHGLVVPADLTVSTAAYLGLADGMQGGARPLGWPWRASAPGYRSAGC